MKEVDYIVIGLGIAGISFCEQLVASQKTFIVIDAARNPATGVAGGVINPVVLKRFTSAWNAPAFLEASVSFYKQLALKLSASFFSEVTIQRIFNSPKEQNDWQLASEGSKVGDYLSSKIHQNENPALNMPYGYGQVLNGHSVNTLLLLQTYREYLSQTEQYREAIFQYEKLVVQEDSILYEDISAQKIVFAQGAEVVKNPFFTKQVLIPKKGEYITIKAPELRLLSIVKGPFFLIPLGEDHYKVGATFAHGDASEVITKQGRLQLEKALEKMIQCPYEVVDQVTGMRPTVKDRRPLLGTLTHTNIAFFNGLGTRGIFMAPLLSKQLFEHLEYNRPLDKEIDIKRF